MKDKTFSPNSAVIQATISSQREHIKLCRALINQFDEEIRIEEDEIKRNKINSAFETYNEKASQIMNIISSVMKSEKDICKSIIENIRS